VKPSERESAPKSSPPSIHPTSKSAVKIAMAEPRSDSLARVTTRAKSTGKM